MLENIASERGLFIYSQQNSNSPTIWFHVRYAVSVRHALLAKTFACPVSSIKISVFCVYLLGHFFQTYIFAKIKMLPKSVISEILCKQEQKMGCLSISLGHMMDSS